MKIAVIGLGIMGGGIANERAGNWPAAINIGPNPTFGEQTLKIEAHLIGFSGNLYGQALELEFISRLRSIRPFESVAALKTQLQHDICATVKIESEQPESNEDSD